MQIVVGWLLKSTALVSVLVVVGLWFYVRP